MQIIISVVRKWGHWQQQHWFCWDSDWRHMDFSWVLELQ